MKLWRVFVVIALSATFLTMVPADAGKKRRKLTKEQHKALILKRNKKAKDYRKDIPFLNFNQFSKLARRQKIEYIKAWREGVVFAGKLQRTWMGGFDKKFDLRVSPRRPSKDASWSLPRSPLWDLLLGRTLNADIEERCQRNPDSCNDEWFARAAFYSDQCITCGGLKDYKGDYNGRTQPGMCQECDGCANPRGGGDTGYKCDFLMFGLNGSKGCIPASMRLRGTEQCDKYAGQERARTESAARQALTRWQSFLDSNTTPSNRFTSEEAKTRIGELMDYAVHDEVMAAILDYFAQIGQYNARHGTNIRPPIFSGDEGANYERFGFRNFNEFRRYFDHAADGTKDFLEDVETHCNKNVTTDVLLEILDAERRDMIRRQIPTFGGFEDARSSFIHAIARDAGADISELESIANNYANNRREDARIKADEILNKVRANKNLNENLLVKHVIQRKQCDIAQERIAQVRDALVGTCSTLPDDPNNPPPCRVADPGPSVPEPEIIVERKKESRSLGCEFSAFGYDTPQAYVKPNAACLGCWAEQSYINANPAGDKSFRISRKWLSLLYTMALACGDYVPGDDRKVSVETMRDYIQRFGMCSESQYSWYPDGQHNLSPYDQSKVHEWQDADKYAAFYDRKRVSTWWRFGDRKAELRLTKEGEDQVREFNADFARIYGADYVSMTKIFCEPRKFKWWWGRGSRKPGDKFPDEGTPYEEATKAWERMERKAPRQLTKTKFSKLGAANPRTLDRDYDMYKQSQGSFMDCMGASKQNSKDLFFENQSNGQCISFVDVPANCVADRQGQNCAAYEDALSEHLNGQGGIHLLDNDCFVTKQVEADGTWVNGQLTPQVSSVRLYSERPPSFALADFGVPSGRELQLVSELIPPEGVRKGTRYVGTDGFTGRPLSDDYTVKVSKYSSETCYNPEKPQQYRDRSATWRNHFDSTESAQ